MNVNNLSKLEKDIKFKKENFPKNFWYKQIAIYPPSAILFIALFGLVYLLNVDMLLTYYAIPFVLLLLLGAIWLKTVKKYITDTIIKKEEGFLVCLAQVFEEKKGFFYIVFDTSKKRHDKHQINNIAKHIKAEMDTNNKDIMNAINSKRATSVTPYNTELFKENEVFIKALPKTEILKLRPNCNVNDHIPIIFFNKKNIIVVKPKYLVFN